MKPDHRIYDGHKIALDWATSRLDNFAWTTWVLHVDDHQFYLDQDAKFVHRVLGRDFAEFLHDAFARAGLHEREDQLAEMKEDERLRLRSSIAWGIVAALEEIWVENGLEFFDELAAGRIDPWSLSAS